MQGNESIHPRAAILTCRIIWLAMLASIFIYAIVASIFGGNIRAGAPLEKDTLGILATAFALVSIVAITGAFLARRYYHSRPALPRDKENPYLKPMGRYLTNMMICLTLSEVPAVLGLVLFFLGGQPVLTAILMVSSALAMICFFPRMEHIEAKMITSGGPQISNRPLM